MSKQIRIALIGLGRVGEVFATQFLEHIQTRHIAATIIAVADHNTQSAVALGFAHSGVSVFSDGLEIVKMGDAVDVIFDLSGNPDFRQRLRTALRDSNNQHTVIAPTVMANLLWAFFDEPENLPETHANTGY